MQAELERIEGEIATAGRGDKAALKASFVVPKARFDDARKKVVDAIKARHKQVTRAVKDLRKLKEERDVREQEVKLAAEREVTHLREAAADLLRICGSDDEAHRYFTLIARAEIVENEFNLNLPRYVDTFEPEGVLSLAAATAQLASTTVAAATAQTALQTLLAKLIAPEAREGDA